MLTDRQIAVALIKDKMFRATVGKGTRLLYIDPKRMVKYIDCPSANVLRSWLREQTQFDHQKGTPWFINPEMALYIVRHYGLA